MSSNPGELLTDEEFRERPEYAELCALYGVSPVLPPESHDMTLGEARHFWQTYEAWRQMCSASTAEVVAVRLAWLLRLHGGGLALTARYADLVSFTDDAHTPWMITVARADDEVVAAAMTRHMHGAMNGGTSN